MKSISSATSAWNFLAFHFIRISVYQHSPAMPKQARAFGVNTYCNIHTIQAIYKFNVFLYNRYLQINMFIEFSFFFPSIFFFLTKTTYATLRNLTFLCFGFMSARKESYYHHFSVKIR